MKRAFKLVSVALILVFAGLTATSPFAQDVDFKGGGNTWSESKAGDWVEYKTMAGLSVRQEVKSVTETDVTYDHITKSTKGDEVGRKEHTREFAKAPVMGRLPQNMDVTWSEEDYELEDGKITCSVASWSKEGSTGSIWFHKDVPCGGIVKTTTDGDDSVWLIAWSKGGKTYTAKTEKEADPKPEPEPEPEPKPQPVPQPGPAPEPLPGPGPQPEPEPEPQPEPEPEPEPEPQPEPQPQPQPEPEPQPEPQPQPEPGPAPAPDYGDPITMKLPESILKQMKDQGSAITRMRVYFDETAENEDGIALEYEGMRTEVPVIYAAFKGDDCDKEISYQEWSSRQGRYVDLAVEIKTAPRQLEGMEVKIVHTHIKGETETELSQFEVTVPEPGEPWDTFRLRGAKPGINRYTLQVTYTNDAGESTTHKGFSHWVIVQAPPMFEFLNGVRATAKRSKAGDNTILKADVSMSSSFILHHGLAPEDCELRITRKGKREMDLSELPAELRRVIGKERIPPGWQEVARMDLTDGEHHGRKVVTVEDQFVNVNFQHALNATGNVLPLSEEWEYRFELHHDDSAEPLATWTVKVNLNIARPEDISKAKLKIRATGLSEPLEVPFKK